MLIYFVRRVYNSVFVLIGISLMVFVSIRSTGDPIALMMKDGNPSAEDILKMRRLLNLDKPIPVQYASFLANAVTGDFGESFRYKVPAFKLVLDRMPATIQLTLASVAVGVLIAFPMGILGALNRGSYIDFGVRSFSLIGMSIPNFWFGIVLILFFGVYLRWLPVSGNDGPEHLIMPAGALGMSLAGTLARLLRSSMLEVMSEDYIRTAQAKGIRISSVLAVHALRNALMPVVTVIGLQFGLLLGGAVIIENVFAWPGVGRLVVNAIGVRDYPVVQAAILMLALILVLVNLAVDLLYRVIDPRVRLE